MEGIGFLWLSSAYGPNNTILRKNFLLALLDLFGLTFPNWCVCVCERRTFGGGGERGF